MEAGTAIYARVSAHTIMSYGYPALSDPEFETPSNVQPGAPAPVRLVETSDSSIAVQWDHPTVDGGANIAGYELWMGEWATSNFRLVYDGVDDEGTTSFTVDTRYNGFTFTQASGIGFLSCKADWTLLCSSD